MKIAIIGGGLSGSLTAIYLLKEAREPLDLYLFEKNKTQLNKGVAYSSTLPYQLLNVPIKDMSLLNEEPAHFFEWLKENGYNYKLTDFAPRDVYGKYIADNFKKQTLKNNKVEVNTIHHEVTSISKDKSSYKIAFGNTEEVIVDKVILSTGNFPPGDVPGLPEQVRNSKNYVSHPWSGFNVNDLSPGIDILMVGSGLTMIDIVLSLQKKGHKGKITVISRRGLLPLSHGDAPEFNLKNGPDLKNATAVSLLDWIKENIEEANTSGHTWRSVFDAVRGYIPAMWAALPEDEKRRFLRHLRPFWEIHRHRMPAESIAILKGMEKTGQLTLLAGRIQTAELQEDKIQITYRCRNENINKHVKVDRIINCTGPETEYRKLRSPLYRSLLDNKLAQVEPLYMGLLATKEGFVIDASGNIDNNMAIIGPPAKGVLWECTALREIRMQAALLAKAVLKD